MPGSKGAGRDPEGNRPQPPIIDVKAVEISERKDAGADSSAEAAVGTPPAGQTETVNPSAQAQAEPEAGEPSAPPPPARRRTIWPALVGALAGVAGGFAAAALLSHLRGDEQRAVEAGRRLQAIEANQQTFASRRAAEDAVQQIKALEARLAAAEKAANRPAGDPALAARVDALDQGGRDMAAAITELRKRLDEMATIVTAARASSASPGEIASLAQRLAAVEQAAKSLEAGLAAPSRGRDAAARFALAVMTLRPLVESGVPYARELAAVKVGGGDAAAAAPLDTFASTGVPPAAALAQEFAALAIPAQAKPPATPTEVSGSLWDRFVAAMSRLVHIRPVERTAAPVTADVARVRALVSGGDLPQALSEAAKLPDVTRQKLEPWVLRVRQRIAALDAMRDLAATAASRLSAGAQ